MLVAGALGWWLCHTCRILGCRNLQSWKQSSSVKQPGPGHLFLESGCAHGHQLRRVSVFTQPNAFQQTFFNYFFFSLCLVFCPRCPEVRADLPVRGDGGRGVHEPGCSRRYQVQLPGPLQHLCPGRVRGKELTLPRREGTPHTFPSPNAFWGWRRGFEPGDPTNVQPGTSWWWRCGEQALHSRAVGT